MNFGRFFLARSVNDVLKVPCLCGHPTWTVEVFRSWYCVKERALKHKFVVGEAVYFTASSMVRPASDGVYEVIRLLPHDGDDCQYRIKSSTEAFERVAKESQLVNA